MLSCYNLHYSRKSFEYICLWIFVHLYLCVPCNCIYEYWIFMWSESNKLIRMCQSSSVQSWNKVDVVGPGWNWTQETFSNLICNRRKSTDYILKTLCEISLFLPRSQCVSNKIVFGEKVIFWFRIKAHSKWNFHSIPKNYVHFTPNTMLILHNHSEEKYVRLSNVHAMAKCITCIQKQNVWRVLHHPLVRTRLINRYLLIHRQSIYIIIYTIHIYIYDTYPFYIPIYIFMWPFVCL